MNIETNPPIIIMKGLKDHLSFEISLSHVDFQHSFPELSPRSKLTGANEYVEFLFSSHSSNKRIPASSR